jgi:hypothetical protein
VPVPLDLSTPKPSFLGSSWGRSCRWNLISQLQSLPGLPLEGSRKDCDSATTSSQLRSPRKKQTPVVSCEINTHKECLLLSTKDKVAFASRLHTLQNHHAPISRNFFCRFYSESSGASESSSCSIPSSPSRTAAFLAAACSFRLML